MYNVKKIIVQYVPTSLVDFTNILPKIFQTSDARNVIAKFKSL